MIDKKGDYLYLKNRSFKFELHSHDFNLRLHQISFFFSFKNKMFNNRTNYPRGAGMQLGRPWSMGSLVKKWQVCDWLAKWWIMLVFRYLRWPKVSRRTDVGFFYLCLSKIANSDRRYHIHVFSHWLRLYTGSIKWTQFTTKEHIDFNRYLTQINWFSVVRVISILLTVSVKSLHASYDQRNVLLTSFSIVVCK